MQIRCSLVFARFFAESRRRFCLHCYVGLLCPFQKNTLEFFTKSDRNCRFVDAFCLFGPNDGRTGGGKVFSGVEK
jgi:hypothetical protein